jgi:hypothetical protein
MHKDKLLGKYVMYENKGAKANGTRLGKVVKITGNTLTIIDAYKERHRIHCKTQRILGVLKKRKISGLTQEQYLEEIEWG